MSPMQRQGSEVGEPACRQKWNDFVVKKVGSAHSDRQLPKMSVTCEEASDRRDVVNFEVVEYQCLEIMQLGAFF